MEDPVAVCAALKGDALAHQAYASTLQRHLFGEPVEEHGGSIEAARFEVLKNAGGALGRRHFITYEVPTRRPASHLPQWPDAKAGVATEKLVHSMTSLPVQKRSRIAVRLRVVSRDPPYWVKDGRVVPVWKKRWVRR
jgi:hypothetical protein